MKIGIAGCKGRMGSMLVNELRSGSWKGVTLAGGTVLPEEMGACDFFITDKADELFKKSDAVIDFTAPAATRQHLWLAAKHKKILVVGTTGLTAADEAEMKDAAAETQIVQSANFSVGVNVLQALVEQAAAALQDGWDIEIFEAHHKHKVDAPSGTALALGKAAAKGRNVEFSPPSLTLPPAGGGKPKAGGGDFHLHGKRENETIGFSVARGGDVVGDHTVYFYGDGERIELTHRATNRALFAKGAIRAALVVKDKPAGLYSMRDLLNL